MTPIQRIPTPFARSDVAQLAGLAGHLGASGSVADCTQTIPACGSLSRLPRRSAGHSPFVDHAQRRVHILGSGARIRRTWLT